MRCLALLLTAVCLAAVEQRGWPGLLAELARWDSPAADWQRFVPTADPGPGVEPEVREAWLAERRREEARQSPTPAPTAIPAQLSPEAVAANPDLLIPVAVRLLDDPAQRDRAVACLIQFHLADARADALRPLLPWLADPAWSKAADRLRLIQSLDRVVLPEAEAGLLLVLTRERGWERRAAAEALGALAAAAAVPGLRQALAEEEDDQHRWAIARALADCHGVDQALAIAALEALAARSTRDWSSWQAQLGAVIDSDVPALRSEALARALLERAGDGATAPAAALRDLVCTWSVPAGRQALLADLASGRIGDAALRRILEHPEDLRQHAADGLRRLIADGGAAAGAAAALLGDAAAMSGILDGSDGPAQAACCTCARLMGLDPPATLGAVLDREHPAARAAAERWLLGSNLPAARAIIAARRPGALTILGRRPDWDPGHATRGVFDELEDLLRSRLRGAQPPLRVRALLSAGYWGDRGQVLIEEHADHAVLVVLPDPDRQRERVLEAEEWTAFRERLAALQVDRLPAAEPSIHDGIQYEHVEADATGGFRVWMNNPQHLPASPWDIVVHRWHRLVEAKPMPVRWPALEAIPGARVLHDSGLPQALAVQGVDGSDGLRVLSIPRRSWGKPQLFQWFQLGAAGPPAACAAPAGWPAAPTTPADGPGIVEHLRANWRAVLDGGELAPREDRALWWLRPGVAPERLVDGLYAHPIVAPAARLVVASRAVGPHWAGAREIVIIDPATRRVTVCPELSKASWQPLAWSASHDAVLLELEEQDERAASDDGAIAAEGQVAAALGHADRPARAPRGALLDPRSGAVRFVAGDFAPWRDQELRPLQPVAGAPGKVWAAVPERQATRLQRYDLASFTGETVLTVHDLHFTSSMCWIDEAAARLLVCSRGDLLAIPLPGR